MSSHPRSLLEMHATLCRQMKNLATFRYDTFSDGLTEFIKALDDFVGDSMAKCKTGKLDGLSRWPLENLRILRQISTNLSAKGGPSKVTLRDCIEMHVSLTVLIFDHHYCDLHLLNLSDVLANIT